MQHFAFHPRRGTISILLLLLLHLPWIPGALQASAPLEAQSQLTAFRDHTGALPQVYGRKSNETPTFELVLDLRFSPLRLKPDAGHVPVADCMQGCIVEAESCSLSARAPPAGV